MLKQIPDFDDYAASEDGEIFRIKYDDNANLALHGLPHRLSSTYDKDGYKKVNFSVNGKTIYKRAHRLIALTFIPNPLNLPFVNHKNGDKSDNRVQNLEWVTAKENTRHAHLTGLHRGCRTSVIFTNTGQKFDSIEEACEYLHHSRDCFRRHLYEGSSTEGEIDGCLFRLEGGKTRRKRGVYENCS